MGFLNAAIDLAQDALHAARTARTDSAAAYDKACKAVKRAERADTGNTMGDVKKLVAANAAAEQASQALTEADQAVNAAQQRVDLEVQLLGEVRRNRRQTREGQIAAALQVAGLLRPDLNIRLQGDGSRDYRVTVQLMELDEAGAVRTKQGQSRDGSTFTYPVDRFGMEATVYAPRVDYNYGGDLTNLGKTYLPTTINWGGIGSQTLAVTTDFVFVLQAASVVARYLDTNSAAWREQDDAD